MRRRSGLVALADALHFVERVNGRIALRREHFTSQPHATHPCADVDAYRPRVRSAIPASDSDRPGDAFEMAQQWCGNEPCA